jgi:DNA polymerase-3 subunit delta'
MALFGHVEAERTLLDAYRSAAMPHAWLISGPSGIGKATLAYRLARFVFANPLAQSAKVQSAGSLAVPPDDPSARRMMAQGLPDLLVLQRSFSDNGTLRSVITVDDVRRTIKFFGSTAGEGGWRICIVDNADELNPPAANALLKILEEPPTRALFLLLSHMPGRLLPTIRSRCRKLILRPLEKPEISAALAIAAPDASELEREEAAAAAEGSVARALALLDERTRRLRKSVNGLLAKLPALDGAELHALGDQLAGVDAAPLTGFVEALNDWLAAQLREPAAERHRLARLAEVWEKIAAAARDVELYNLERKPLVFAAFGLLSEAARP